MKPRRLRPIGIPVFLVLAVMTATVAAAIWGTRTQPAPAHPEWPPAGAQHASVERVVDGDTLIAVVDGVRERIRLIGIDAPELARDGHAGEPYAQEAADRLAARVTGQIVWLIQDVSDRDIYGRLLRYVHLEDGTCINCLLAREGWAVVKKYPPDTARHDELADAQRLARKEGAGIWSPAP